MHGLTPFFGNASTDHFGRGWVIGGFIEDPEDIRRSSAVEVKWSTHPAGDRRAEWTTGEARTTVSFMVSGRFVIRLSTGTHVLTKPGDYLVWGPGTEHSWEALEDSVMITARWPSAGTTL